MIGLATALSVMSMLEESEMDKYASLDVNDVSGLLQAKLKVLDDGCFGEDQRFLFSSNEQEREWVKNLLAEIEELIFMNARALNR